MKPEVQHAAALENALADLRAEGFHVLVRPSRPALPIFLKNYTPDAIAVRGDQKLVIEVLSSERSSTQRLDRLREVLAHEKGWQLQVIWVSSSSAPDGLETAPRRVIEQFIRDVNALLANENLRPALLMAWAIFEALGRALLPEEFRRPQTPGRLVEVLAQNGQLTPDEADHLRKLANSRNRLIHGVLQQEVSKADIEKFVEVLKTLITLLPRKTVSTDNVKPHPKTIGARVRDTSGQIRRERGDTLVGTLRKVYGRDFAKGYRSNAKLSDVLKREGVASVNQLRKKDT